MYTNLYGQSKLLFIAQVDDPSSNKGGQINRKRWSIQQRRTKETVEYGSILNSILLQLCVLTWTVRFIAKSSHIDENTLNQFLDCILMFHSVMRIYFRISVRFTELWGSVRRSTRSQSLFTGIHVGNRDIGQPLIPPMHICSACHRR